MRYIVQVVGDDALPQDIHSVIVEREVGPAVLLINGPVARCWQMMRAWEDTHEPCTVPSISIPAQYAHLVAAS